MISSMDVACVLADGLCCMQRWMSDGCNVSLHWRLLTQRNRTSYQLY